jgi:hypothetical protein
MTKRLLTIFLVFCTLYFNATLSISAEKDSIQSRTNKLKDEVIQLNRDLFELEESILHPANTQVAVFLSVNTKEAFMLDSIELKIDGRTATTYLYRDSELKAFAKGGVQRLYVGNISTGPHKISAVFNGQGSNDRYYRRDKTFGFEKTDKSKFIELSISDSRKSSEPEFTIKEWR